MAGGIMLHELTNMDRLVLDMEWAEAREANYEILMGDFLEPAIGKCVSYRERTKYIKPEKEKEKEAELAAAAAVAEDKQETAPSQASETYVEDRSLVYGEISYHPFAVAIQVRPPPPARTGSGGNGAGPACVASVTRTSFFSLLTSPHAPTARTPRTRTSENQMHARQAE